MNEAVQVAPGVWVLHDEEDGSNTSVVLRDEAALVVRSAPVGMHPAVEKAIGELFASAGRDIEGLDVVLGGTGSSVEGDAGESLPLPGWAILTSGAEGRQMIYSGSERILFSGEMLTGIDVPVLAHGGQAYLDGLAGVETLDPRLIVPSRGEPAQGKREIRQRIERERQYIWALQRHVQTAMASRISLERTLAGARTIYEDYPFVEAHLANVAAIWDETLTLLGGAERG